jgi:uncharacterized membrane protein YfcA
MLSLAALLAGFVDAVAGGGGLIQVPALFNALPAETPATIFGRLVHAPLTCRNT